MPGIEPIELDAHVVLLVFVPPLLLSAGWYSSPRELRAESRALGLLALALVLVTMSVIAVAAHELVAALTWPAAFMLGAVVAPTDAVAAVATFATVRVPERVKLLVQGESLINDATGLTAFSVALVAADKGFSLDGALLEFVLKAVGGTAVGIAVAWVILRAIRRQPDVTVSVLLTVFAAYGSYVAAEEIHASGILAAAVCGLYSGWHQSEYFDADTRLTASAFWKIMVFGLEALLFILLGLQLKSVADEVGEGADGHAGGDRRAALGAGDRGPRRLRAAPARARPVAQGAGRRRLVRDARGDLARRRAVDHRRHPGPRRGHLPHVRRDPGDARRPGPDAAGADPRAAAPGRARVEPRGGDRAPGGGAVRARPARRARGGASGSARSRCGGCATSTARASGSAWP